MVVAREHREKLMQYCRAGLVEMAFGIVWEEPGIVRDAGCVPLVAGGNPTMARVLRAMSERLAMMDMEELATIAIGRSSDWLLDLVALPGLAGATLVKILAIAMGEAGKPFDSSLCIGVVRKLDAGRADVHKAPELVATIARMLALGHLFADDDRRLIMESLGTMVVRPKGEDG